ncbi:MAG: hypothetical protein AABX72_03315 [Nanoarchaeota archaeon]
MKNKADYITEALEGIGEGLFSGIIALGAMPSTYRSRREEVMRVFERTHDPLYEKIRYATSAISFPLGTAAMGVGITAYASQGSLLGQGILAGLCVTNIVSWGYEYHTSK